MKEKALTLLGIIILVFSFTAATADVENLAAPFPDGSAEAALTARIAEEIGCNYIPTDGTTSVNNEIRAEAANRMLEETGTLLCDTQSAFMASLQGYTAEDLRTAMAPVCRVARCPLYLVMNAETAEEKEIVDGGSFLAYLMKNEYDDSLLLARHVEADPQDRAAVFLTDQLPLLTDLFWPDEVPDALENGDAALAVYSETELNASTKESLLILFALGSERSGFHQNIPALPESGLEACPEPALYLMARAGEDESCLQEAARKITSSDLAADCLSAGFVFDPLSGEALTEEISVIFADYKEYMTAEGLFFYESD